MVKTPDVAFLGVCDRAVQVRPGHPFMSYYNIIGLRYIVFPAIYPFSISNLIFIFAIFSPEDFEQAHLSILDESGNEAFGIDITMYIEKPVASEGKEDIIELQIPEGMPGWALLPYIIPKGLILKPTNYDIILERKNEKMKIGKLVFGLRQAPPLTLDRITAIKSNPMAIKALKYGLKCEICKDEIIGYCALERDEKIPADSIWYQEMPGHFKCKCGKYNIELKYIKENMHTLLGTAAPEEENVSATRMYEKHALVQTARDFLNLLNDNPNEEKVLEYIKQHPILLQKFSPEHVFFKLPVLTKYVTDIVIINPKNELLLIEIEQPGKKILKKDDGITAHTHHAIKQVSDWLYEYERHQNTVIDCMGIKDHKISKAKGIVIIGRDIDYKADQLQKLRWKEYGKNIEVFTYDDLLRDLGVLIKNVSQA